MLQAKIVKIRGELDKFCKELGVRFNVEFKVGRITYHDTGGQLSIEFAEEDKDGNLLDRSAKMFQSYASEYGLKRNMLFQEFVYDGEGFKIIGLNRRKYPRVVECVRDDGKLWNFIPQHILKIMK